MAAFDFSNPCPCWIGSLTGSPSGAQTLMRDHLAGLITLLSLTQGVAKVVKSACKGWGKQSHPSHPDLWGLLCDKQRCERHRVIPCFNNTSQEFLQLPHSQCYPDLLSRVQAAVRAKVQGLQNPSVCQVLVSCDAFAKQVFFNLSQCVWLLSARPGGHPMKPLKLVVAHHLTKRKRWEVGVGKGPGGRTLADFLKALPNDPEYLWTGHRWHAQIWTVKCANCKKYVKFRQSWKEVTPIVLTPSPAVSKPPETTDAADEDRLSCRPHRPARRKLAEQVVAEMSRLSHERPEQHAVCIEGDVLLCRTCDRRWSVQAPCKVLRQLGGEKCGAQHSLSDFTKTLSSCDMCVGTLDFACSGWSF